MAVVSWNQGVVVVTVFVLLLSGSMPGNGETITGERFVVLLTGPSEVSAGDTLPGAKVLHVLPQINAALVETHEPQTLLSKLAQDPRVEAAARDHEGVRAADHGLSPPAFFDLPSVPDAPTTGQGGLPNDLYHGTQYGVHQVRLPLVWEATGAEANDIVLCVPDSGIRSTHEETRGGRYQGGYDFINFDDDPAADHYHGTFTTTIATGNRDNGAGITGAMMAPFYHTKVLGDTGHGNWYAVVGGLLWCADLPHERVVISLSVGGFPTDPGQEPLEQMLRASVEYTHAKGRLIVASAMNENSVRPVCLDCIGYPAVYPEVVAVTSTSPGHVSSWWSSFGPEAEIAAPGDVILSASHGSDQEYTLFSGTSFSAPLVAGTAALVWSQHPTLDAEELRARLRETSRDFGPPGHDVFYGHGEMDALCFLEGTTPCLV